VAARLPSILTQVYLVIREAGDNGSGALRFQASLARLQPALQAAYIQEHRQKVAQR
jgi:hypothetical protein